MQGLTTTTPILTSFSTSIPSHNLGISPIRNADDRDRDRCFSLGGAFSGKTRDGWNEGRNGESRREMQHTHRGSSTAAARYRRRSPVSLLSIGWRSAKMEKGNAGLINDILNTRRGAMTEVFRIATTRGRAVSCGACRRNLAISCASSSE